MDPRSDFSQNLITIIHDELEKVDTRFDADIRSIMFRRNFNPEKPFLDMHLYYPFWLSHSFKMAGSEDVVEKLTRFNFWYGFHTFIQDDLVDEPPLGIDPHKNVLFSDYILFKSLMNLEDLTLKMRLNLARDAVKLYGDYIDCILWEKRGSSSSNPSDADLLWFGKKFSMLKINNLVFTRLSGREDLLEDLNSFLENYHICMQLIDDLKDWRVDLAHGHISYFLNYVIRNCDNINNNEDLDKIIANSEFARRMAEKAMDYLLLARSNVKHIDNPFLNSLIDEGEDSIQTILLGREQNREELIEKVVSILSESE